MIVPEDLLAVQVVNLHLQIWSTRRQASTRLDLTEEPELLNTSRGTAIPIEHIIVVTNNLIRSRGRVRGLTISTLIVTSPVGGGI